MARPTRWRARPSGGFYGESDRILGRVLEVLKPEDRLIVLSDHGFESFRRAVHLNRWLAKAGYLALKPDASSSDALFANVDWTKTKASRSASTASSSI